MGPDLISLITAFTLVLLSELGDKTQLAVMMLSSKGSSMSVLAGAMLAFFLVDGVSILIGGELLSLLPYRFVSLGSGLLFIFFGGFSLLRRNGKKEIESPKATFFKTFSIISVMELGDKTQLAAIVLAAEFRNSLGVLTGTMLAFLVVTVIGVIFGVKLLRLLPEKYLRIGTSVLFMFFGIIFILSAIMA